MNPKVKSPDPFPILNAKESNFYNQRINLINQTNTTLLIASQNLQYKDVPPRSRSNMAAPTTQQQASIEVTDTLVQSLFENTNPKHKCHR